MKTPPDPDRPEPHNKHRNSLSWAILIGSAALLTGAGIAKIVFATPDHRAAAAAEVLTVVFSITSGLVGAVVGYYFGDKRKSSDSEQKKRTSPSGLIEIRETRAARHVNSLAWAIIVGSGIAVIAGCAAKIYFAGSDDQETAAGEVFTLVTSFVSGLLGGVIGYYFRENKN